MMIQKIATFSALFTIVSCGIYAAEPSWQLTREGQPASLIILPAKESVAPQENETLLKAATLLQDHIREISGAALSVAREDEIDGLAVAEGRIHWPAAPESVILLGADKLAAQLGVTSANLGSGGIRLKTTGNAVVLLGNADDIDPDAIIYATVALLEALGCRYLWPGDLGRVIPHEQSLALAALDIDFTPPIVQREIRWWMMRPDIHERLAQGLERLQIDNHAAWQKMAQTTATASTTSIEWRQWHGLGGDLGLKGTHSGAGTQYAANWRKALDEHPEWYALQADGTRGGYIPRYRLCKSNPELIKFVAEAIISYINTNKSQRSVSLSPNDGTYSTFCMCDNCKQFDPPEAPKVRLAIYAKQGEPKRTQIQYPSLSDRMMRYWNSVAAEVVKVHPDLLFVVDAYSRFKTPPVRERPHPNLIVRYVSLDKEGWLGWRKTGIKRIYWRPNLFWPGVKTGRIHLTTKESADFYPFAAANGALATDLDSILDHWALYGLHYYVAARLNWDPNRKLDEIVDDYCQAGFGAGAAHIARYFRVAEALGDSSYLATDAELDLLQSQLDRASEATLDDETFQERIAFLRKGFNFHRLHTVLERMAVAASAKEPFDRQEANKLLNLNYVMMRDIALNHVLTVNTPHFISRSGHISHLRPIGGRGFTATPEVMEAAQGRSMTGRERSLQELLQVYNMADVAETKGKANKVKLELTADEDGQAVEN